MLFSSFLAIAYATETSQTQEYTTHPPSNHVNFRMGASSATSNGRPTLCLEGTIRQHFAVESCGTGYGFLHQDPGIDFVHFRGKWDVITKEYSRTQIQGQVGAGFAEVQLAGDELGFQFTGAKNGIETAGPEVTTSVQVLRDLGLGSELIVDANIGAAFFRHGPELIVPQRQFFPFCEFSVGVGW